MNLTFTLDSQRAGTFLHTGKASTPISTFTPSVVVFQKTGLPASPHSLTVSVGPDSVFLLDYIVYTAESDFEQVANSTSSSPSTAANSTIPAGAARSSPSPSVNGCVNSAYTSGPVDLLANHSYLPFAVTSVLALALFCVRCSLDLDLIRSFIYRCHSPVDCLLLHPTLSATSHRSLFVVDVVPPRNRHFVHPLCSSLTMHIALLPRTTTSNDSSRSSSHSVATFAGAIGGSVGLLTVLAVSLALSIYRRRRRARRRDRAYREARGAASISSFHTDGSEDGPPMQGPEPFVPRYFPGTVITAAPPPYSPPASPSNDQTSALLGPPETPMASMSWSSRRTGGVISDSDSYADRPPPTPPNNGSVVGFDEDGYFNAPPPFPVAIATPVPAILAGLSGVVSTSPAPMTSRPTTPASPVIPLLPPPPSSRPASLHSTHEQTPGAGPSGTQTRRAPTPPAQLVASSRVSVRSLSVHTSEESAMSADCETNSISRRSPEPNRAGATAPVLISPISSITDSQGGTGAQERGHRSEGEVDTARR